MASNVVTGIATRVTPSVIPLSFPEGPLLFTVSPGAASQVQVEYYSGTTWTVVPGLSSVSVSTTATLDVAVLVTQVQVTVLSGDSVASFSVSPVTSSSVVSGSVGFFGSLALGTPLGVSDGGTGAATAAAALVSLGGAPAPLSATTASLGGSALVAGAVATATTNVPGATIGMEVTTTPQTYPGAGMVWSSYVSSAGVITTQVCAVVAGTPVASLYNIRVFQ